MSYGPTLHRVKSAQTLRLLLDAGASRGMARVPEDQRREAGSATLKIVYFEDDRCTVDK